MLDNAAVTAPRWLKAAEKQEFARVIEARNSLGNPVSAAELNALVDYVGTRSRLRTLRRMEAQADYPAERLAAMRAIETATSTSRRLGKDLHLTGDRT